MSDRAREHELKTWPSYFQAILDGRKHFEIRENDRDFREGDTLILKEYNPDFPFASRYTGRQLERTVIYMTNFGQANRYVVLGLDIAAALAAERAKVWEEAANEFESRIASAACNGSNSIDVPDFINWCRQQAEAEGKG